MPRLLPLLASVLLATVAFAQDTRRLYLSGKGTDDAVPWDFRVSAGKNAGRWTSLPVPSCWDMHNFGTLHYGRQPRGTPYAGEHGEYRYKFTVPADWFGQTVFIVFDGSMTDTAVSINGQPAGPVHQGAFYRFRHDVTKLVKFGAENLLEVTVHKESADESVNRAERRGDYWVFGGIFRPVYLEARPPHHIDRLAIDARADGAFVVDVYTASATPTDTLRAQIVDANGTPAGEAFTAPVGADAKTTLRTKIESPRTWTAETPNLYHVELSLVRGNRVLHRTRQRFGFRTLEVRPAAGIFVNGWRVLLKGTNRHTFHPETGRASSEKLSRLDIALMKEMNNNAVRMSHYPPDEHFLDLCDELGLYVLDELAGWQKYYDEPTARRLISQMVPRDVNHPSILFWDNGNEGGWNTAVDDDFARWDPQRRPVLHPWDPFRGINTKHYPVYDLAVRLSQGPDLFMPTEFMHALHDGGGGAGLADYWDLIRTSKFGAGGFIWAFVDECVKRPDSGALDGQGNQAPDGVLGPYREKEGSFYTVKELWSPVVLRRDDAGKITVENRYDFTDTARCTFTRELRRFRRAHESDPGFTVVATDKLTAPSIAPHATGALELPAHEKQSEADALAIRVDDPQGRELWTWVWPLRSTRDLSTVGSAYSGPAATTSETPDTLTVSAPHLTVTFSKQSGLLTSIARSGKTFPLTNGPRPAVGAAKLTSLTHTQDGAAILVTANYTGDLKQVTWRVHPNAVLDLDYTYTPAPGQYDFLGLSFDLPDDAVSSVRYLGNGPYRAWKNRRDGATLSVWQNAFNDTMTGHAGWTYPEFKGYYANVHWMRLTTPAGQLLLTFDTPDLFVQLLRPRFPGDPKPFSPTTAATRPINQGSHPSANAWAHFPSANFSILHAIAPIGTKFNTPSQLGPQSQQTPAAPEYRATAHFHFPPGK